ncbi:EXS-domain-containing protein [Hypoxylon sp. FL1150]|nr:EXS-domain-containing protein [Hypoxylon sp. FL1150]
MKFAKELEQDLVPEWRVKYLNYKAGKKNIKAVARAINKANGTPRGLGRKNDLPLRDGTPRQPRGSFRQQNSAEIAAADEAESLRASPAPMGFATRGTHGAGETQPKPIPAPTERQSLTASPGNDVRYGSFVPTPPPAEESWNLFELPAPAMRVPSNDPTSARPTIKPAAALREPLSRHSVKRSYSGPVTSAGGPQISTPPRPSPMFQQNTPPNRLRRMFSAGQYHLTQQLTRTESGKFGYGLQTLDTVRQREADFFDFLDSELDKVETFYRQKEDQAGKRLAALREQLHEMRNRRTQELAELRKRKERGEDSGDHDSNGTSSGVKSHNWADPIRSRIFKPGANSKAFSKLHFTPVIGAMGGDARRDYIRRPSSHDVPYRTAKRKLKLALQEFYRGLELLQSYAQLNRTAFRKLNKKYDKAVHARPPYRYMNEKVNKSWFVNSSTVDEYIHAVEDLYARYFEKGNRKIATGKLHRLNRRPGDESANAFRNGLFIGTGAVFTLQGLVYGSQLLFDPDPVVQQQTSYLMQIYGGYFLILVLMFYFCLDCYMWTKNKINYPFIFEFDTRNSLDWRQLSSFPSFFLLLFGIFFWINFTRYGTQEMYLYYPVILIAPVLWHRSRQWLMYSHVSNVFLNTAIVNLTYYYQYRLFFAGLYPNIELFFCLYAHHWSNPVQCNSNNSRLLGFFSALPPVWRALQCIRRYRDTRNIFPHLVNGGKYGMTIISSVMLSLYRISGSETNLGLFVTFSILNSIYTSIWDLFMDFSFFQPDARHRFLRDILGLKRRWLYYVVMVLDPILRFGWIFYAIFTHNKQHSTIVSFLVAFAEVTRRGLWALFRVENEHCANVAQYKASRDVPLPYMLPSHEPLVERASIEEAEEEEQRRATAPTAASTPAQLQPALPVEGATTDAVGISTAGASALGREQAGAQSQSQAQAQSQEQAEGGLRWRRRPEARPRARSIRGIIADAHRQDFEKRRRPLDTAPEDAEDHLAEEEEVPSEEDDDDDDDDDEDTGSMLDERMEVRRVQGLVRPDTSGDSV